MNTDINLPAVQYHLSLKAHCQCGLCILGLEIITNWCLFSFFDWLPDVSDNYGLDHCFTRGRSATIHQVTIMPSISKNVFFPGHNHLLTTGADDSLLAGTRAITKVLHHQHRWLAGVMTWI